MPTEALPCPDVAVRLDGLRVHDVPPTDFITGCRCNAGPTIRMSDPTRPEGEPDRSTHAVEGSDEVGNQIVRGLDADREADERRVHLER